MDDDLLRRRLSAVEGQAVPRREFVDALHDELAARLGFIDVPTTGSQGSLGARKGRMVRRWAMLAAVLALLVLAAANMAAIGSIVDRLFSGPTLLETIQSSGRLRIAVRADDPQSTSSTGNVQGFDVDLAAVIAERLGADDELVVLTVEEMLGRETGRWQIAFPSRVVPPADAAGLLATGPTYRWPAYVVVADGSPVERIGDLQGSTVCVVAGSAGAFWQAGEGTQRGLIVLAEPPATARMEAASDTACLDELAAGRASAVVTDRRLEPDLATRDGLSIVGDAPVALDPSSIVVHADGPGSAALRDRIDEILEALRQDGTLRDMSQRWFGGEDLTAPTERP